MYIENVELKLIFEIFINQLKRFMFNDFDSL